MVQSSNEPTPKAPVPSGNPEVPQDVIQQIGSMTRMLHDTMYQLGVLPALQVAAEGIPDARSRLSYVASKTADSANRALSAVDAAKDDLAACRSVAQGVAELSAADREGTRRLIDELRARHNAIDGHLTEIMLAQDFHDLTGQVISKVVRLANDLEDGLVKLLVQVAGAGQRAPDGVTSATDFLGPGDSLPAGSGALKSQSEVDDLLSSLGF